MWCGECFTWTELNSLRSKLKKQLEGDVMHKKKINQLLFFALAFFSMMVIFTEFYLIDTFTLRKTQLLSNLTFRLFNYVSNINVILSALVISTFIFLLSKKFNRLSLKSIIIIFCYTQISMIVYLTIKLLLTIWWTKLAVLTDNKFEHLKNEFDSSLDNEASRQNGGNGEQYIQSVPA